MRVKTAHRSCALQLGLGLGKSFTIFFSNPVDTHPHFLHINKHAESKCSGGPNRVQVFLQNSNSDSRSQKIQRTWTVKKYGMEYPCRSKKKYEFLLLMRVVGILRELF